MKIVRCVVKKSCKGQRQQPEQTRYRAGSRKGYLKANRDRSEQHQDRCTTPDPAEAEELLLFFVIHRKAIILQAAYPGATALTICSYKKLRNPAPVFLPVNQNTQSAGAGVQNVYATVI